MVDYSRIMSPYLIVSGHYTEKLMTHNKHKQKFRNPLRLSLCNCLDASHYFTNSSVHFATQILTSSSLLTFWNWLTKVSCKDCYYVFFLEILRINNL